MEPYQERVVAEVKELREKHDALCGFIMTPQFDGLPDDERNRLSRQAIYMMKYAQVLDERIAAF